MSSLTDIGSLSKLVLVLRIFGNSFLHFRKLCLVLKRFIYGEEAEITKSEDVEK